MPLCGLSYNLLVIRKIVNKGVMTVLISMKLMYAEQGMQVLT